MRTKLNELAEQAKKDEVYPSKLFPPSLYYRFLFRLAEWKKPKLSVVLGVCGGGCALHLSKANEGKVIGVDYQYDHPEHIKHIETNFQNFEFMLEDSVKSAEKIYKKHGLIDILFIDTDHRYDRTLKEFNAYKPYMAPGGLMLFDDLFRHHPHDEKGVGDAWDEIEAEKCRIDELHDGDYPHGGGFGIAWNF